LVAYKVRLGQSGKSTALKTLSLNFLVVSWDLRQINFIIYGSIPLSITEKSKERKDLLPDFKKLLIIARRVTISSGGNMCWPEFNLSSKYLRKNRGSAKITSPMASTSSNSSMCIGGNFAAGFCL
jgi:hypothetical protein